MAGQLQAKLVAGDEIVREPASCAFMMSVATPPNAVVFGGDRVRISEMRGSASTSKLWAHR